MSGVRQFVREMWEHRELLLILVQRNLKIRYKGSALGFFWSLASPLFFILIYGTFIRMIARGFAFDLRVLVTGIIVWQFTALCAGDSLNAIIGNTNLVKKTAFPRAILPVSTVLANLVNFMMSAIVLVVYLAVSRSPFNGALAGWLPAILVTHVALCLGISMLLSAGNVFFRDTEHILSHAMTAWFFLTPVIYPLSLPMSIVGEKLPGLAWAYFLNPMAGIVSGYRAVLLSEEGVSPSSLAISAAVAWAALLAGAVIFQGTQKRFADEL